MTSAEHASLFERVVGASGLSGVFASGALRRAITRAGFDPDRLTHDELQRALPSIKLALGVFLSAPEVEAHMDRLAMLTSAPATPKR